ncbi:sulfite exporter TauE/SafE family protein [Granulosicoccaceae sp. 1_MG-2023]|nr:sulfite exporter TauE/SafE family protein [Granulosicoccaceae sp. 1_MG-2023]
MSADTSLLLTALLIGLLGSTHCIGMCGGIVSALTLGIKPAAGQPLNKLPYMLAYNAGRISSYMFAGVIAGALGKTLLDSVNESLAIGLTRWVTGLFLIALGLYLGGFTAALAPVENAGKHLWKHLQPLTRRLLPLSSLSRAYASGLLWGWLPCGLVYSALVWAVGSADPLRGALLMLVFGLATLPAMLLTGAAALRFGHFTRHRAVRRIAAAVLILLGLLQLAGISAGTLIPVAAA